MQTSPSTEFQTGLEKLKTKIDGIRIAMMTGVPENNIFRSRPMTLIECDAQGCFWFFTNENTQQTEQIDNTNLVNLAFVDSANSVYVSVSGSGKIVKDASKIHQLWNPMLKAWFPKGTDDPNLALLCIQANEAEYWDAPDSKIVQLFGITKSILTGSTYKGGSHEKLSL